MEKNDENSNTTLSLWNLHLGVQQMIWGCTEKMWHGSRETQEGLRLFSAFSATALLSSSLVFPYKVHEQMIYSRGYFNHRTLLDEPGWVPASSHNAYPKKKKKMIWSEFMKRRKMRAKNRGERRGEVRKGQKLCHEKKVEERDKKAASNWVAA